jgi:hypothetical protein
MHHMVLNMALISHRVRDRQRERALAGQHRASDPVLSPAIGGTVGPQRICDQRFGTEVIDNG